MITSSCLIDEEEKQLVKHKHAYFEHEYKQDHIYSENAPQVLEATIPYMYELNSDTAENSGGAEREMRLLIHQSIVGGVSSLAHKQNSSIIVSYFLLRSLEKVVTTTRCIQDFVSSSDNWKEWSAHQGDPRE